MATEAWMRGPLEGYADELQPVAHALVQAREDVERLLADAGDDVLHRAPGRAAPAAFHVRHMAGSLDRLLTYARGEMLSDVQMATLRGESQPDSAGVQELRALALDAIDRALEQVRTTDPSTLSERRGVGRKQLPSTVRGLLFHAAEHTTRHIGQLSTTLRALAP